MSSGGENDTLLDVFVAVRPDQKLLEAFNQTIEETVRTTRTAFSSLQAQSDITAAKMKQVQSLVGQRPSAPPPAPAVEAGEAAQNDRYKELRSRIREATDELQILQQTLRFTQADLKELGQSDLATPFQSAVRSASALSLELRQIRPASAMDDEQFDQAEDSINSVISRIEDLRRTVAEARAGSQIQLTVNLDTEKVIAEIQSRIAETEDQIKNRKIDISSRLPQIVGSASAEDREKIYELRAEIERAQVVAERFRASLNGTPESLERLEGALIGVRNANDDLNKELGSIADDRGRSFNNLANNAYQLGQAFEDAAIGFQLNGITGAVRGASNNVAFLLNDLSRIPAVQTKIAGLFGSTAQKVGDIIPLAAGIGAALAVTVLPVVVEWLESLNDVDLKIKDVSNSIKSEFRDTDFQIQISGDERSFARSVSDLGSVEDILKRISEMQSEVSDKTLNLQELFRGLQGSANFDEIMSQFPTISGAVSVEIERLKKNLETFRGLSAISAVKGGPTQELAIQTRDQIASLDSLVRAIEAMQFEMDLAQTQAAQGFFDNNQIQNIKKTLQGIGEELKTFTVSTGTVDKEFSSKLIANVTAISERFEKIAEETAMISSLTGNQLTSAIDAAVIKTVELADKQALLRKQIEGSASEQSMFLLDVRDISRVYEELIDQTVEFYRSRGQDPTAIQEILRQQEIFASENRVLERQKTLAEKLTDAEDRLGKLREKNGESQSRRSRQLTLEAVSSSLQESVLSIESSSVKDNTDAINELTDEIASLNFEIARLDATRANLQTQFTDPAGFSARQRGISFAQPFAAVDFMASPFAAVNAAVRQIPSTSEVLSGPTITESVRLGIEQALEKFIPSLKAGQNGIRDAIQQQDTKSRAAQ